MPISIKLVFLTFFSFFPKPGKRISMSKFCKDDVDS